MRNDYYIFGARAVAVGMYKALSSLKPDLSMAGFIVSKLEDNPANIEVVPVLSLHSFALKISEEEKNNTVIYVAVPEIIHAEVSMLISSKGFHNMVMVDSRYEADIMEQYYRSAGLFPTVHDLSLVDIGSADKVSVYAAKFYRDKALENPPVVPSYVKQLYLGCCSAHCLGLDISGQADFYDDTGDNISAKNPNRCEMTAHYWIWRNRLDTDDEYVGVYHYRRFLDMSDDDLRRMKANDVDVVLPFPMIHYPSALIHHTWYVREEDWLVMRQVLRELHPEYDARFDEIFAQPYFYNYNIMIAKKSVFADYCAWLFPILDAIEERSEPKGKDRADRYTAYMSESLTTLYFMYHQQDFKIYHTGRLLFT